VVEPGTHLEERIRRQQFVMPDAQGMLRELRGIIAETNVTQALFRTDHAAAYLSLSGTLPADKQTLLDRLDEAMAEPEQAASTRSEDARVP
jgi:hypothetical protein